MSDAHPKPYHTLLETRPIAIDSTIILDESLATISLHEDDANHHVGRAMIVAAHVR